MTTATTAAPTVLVIDDEMGILDTIRILLKSEGFIPYTALGGKKGLDVECGGIGKARRGH